MRRAVCLVLLILATGCGGKSPAGPSTNNPPPTVTPVPAPPTNEPVGPAPPPTPQPQPQTPRLRHTKFMAFGDSLTEGRIAVSLTQLVVVPGSYPDRLQQALGARYAAQTIQVLNEGVGGEWAEDGADRFPSVLRGHNPQVVILLEGVNELNTFGRNGIQRAIRALERMAKDARMRGAAVMIANLPPQRSNGPSAAVVRDYNAAVRDLARGEGALFVDLFAAFGGTADPALIGPDGLHPTPAGYQRMSDAFLEAIRANYEDADAVPTLTSARP